MALSPTAARILVALAVVGACASVSGCNSLQSDPVTLIKAPRLIAIQADPPYIAGPGLPGVSLGTPTKLRPLMVARTPVPNLCYAWRLCPFAWSKDGLYRCVDERLEVDLGTKETAQVTALDVFASLEQFEEVAETIGLNVGPPRGASPGGSSSGGEQVESALGLEVSILFMVGSADLWGGKCPTDSREMLKEVCPSRVGCVSGYTQLALATKAAQTNKAPEMTGWTLDGVDWPASVTPTIAPVQGAGDDDSVGPPADKTGFETRPLFDESAIELIKAATDEQPEVRENLTFSWFSTNGRFRYSKTTELVPTNNFSPVAPGKDNADEVGKAAVEATIWLVARDSRNGVSWQTRNVIVDTKADPSVHPLCAQNPALKGCDEVAK